MCPQSRDGDSIHSIQVCVFSDWNFSPTPNAGLDAIVQIRQYVPMTARVATLAGWRPVIGYACGGLGSASRASLASPSKTWTCSSLSRLGTTRLRRQVSRRASPLYQAPKNAADVWWLPLTYDEALLVQPSKAVDPNAHPQQVQRAVANAFLRHVLSQYTSIRPEALRISRTDRGKPYLEESPIKFNMSHADGLVGIAVSSSDVGIDLEMQGRQLRNRGNEVKLARRYFSEAEAASLEHETDAKARRSLFIRLWTLKEAYVKAVGRGIGTPPGLSSFTLSLDAGDIEFRPGDNEPGRHGSWNFGLLEPIDGSLAAVCVKGSDDLPALRQGSPVASQRYAAPSDFLES